MKYHLALSQRLFEWYCSLHQLSRVGEITVLAAYHAYSPSSATFDGVRKVPTQFSCTLRDIALQALPGSAYDCIVGSHKHSVFLSLIFQACALFDFNVCHLHNARYVQSCMKYCECLHIESILLTILLGILIALQELWCLCFHVFSV